MFFPPIPLIRKNHILKKLKQAQAFSEDSAKSLVEIGIINPFAFQNITKRMVKREIIKRTEEGKYYINLKKM